MNYLRKNPSMSTTYHTMRWVGQDKETTKVCVVNDASAKMMGLSLKDCLYVGPKLNMKIFNIPLRFWAYCIAIIADTEKAFLMISAAN